MRKHSPVFAVLAALILGFSLAACSSGSSTTSSSGDAAQNAQQAKDETQLQYVEPLPYFSYSEIRWEAIELEATQALGINTESYGFMYDKLVWTCPSIGLPVPSTTQLSNPYSAQWNVQGGYNSNNNVAGVAVGQPEPTGIFTGDSTGTYSLCVTANGKRYFQYNEGFTDATTAPSHWNGSQIVTTGEPALPSCAGYNLGTKKAKALCVKSGARLPAGGTPFNG